MKILIAEDEPASALYLRRVLERKGHEVAAAADGAEAWEALQAGQFAVVISDWGMPRMDGPELCRRARERGRDGNDYVYIILLTSRDARQDRLDGLRAGADDFLTKPTDPDELEVRLEIAARILAVHEKLARQNAELARIASLDELTGVKNRRRFREDLALFHAVSDRQACPLSLLLFDVDHFKAYNDAFGHPAGDEALRRVAQTIQASTRAQDVVARYGGEEFAVLLPATPARPAAMLADRLRARVAALDWPLRPVTASVGVATTCPALNDPEALVAAADRALYRAKRAGRDRVCQADEEGAG